MGPLWETVPLARGKLQLNADHDDEILSFSPLPRSANFGSWKGFMFVLTSVINRKHTTHLDIVGVSGTGEVGVDFFLVLPFVQVFKLHTDVIGWLLIGVVSCVEGEKSYWESRRLQCSWDYLFCCTVNSSKAQGKSVLSGFTVAEYSRPLRLHLPPSHSTSQPIYCIVYHSLILT